MDKLELIQKEIEVVVKVQRQMLEEMLEMKKALVSLTSLVTSNDKLLDNRSSTSDSKETENSESTLTKGWTFSLRNTGTKEKYWYVGKRIKGTLKWIYVGKDKSKAESKIKAWLEKQESISQEKPISEEKETPKLENKKAETEIEKPTQSLTKEEIEEFHKKRKEFYNHCEKLLEEFPKKEESSLKELEDVANKFISKQSKKEAKVAAEVLFIQEKGAFQSIYNGAYWKKCGLPFYSIEANVSNLLSNNSLKKEDLLILCDLLIIGASSKKSKKELENFLIKQISLRGNTRSF